MRSIPFVLAALGCLGAPATDARADQPPSAEASKLLEVPLERVDREAYLRDPQSDYIPISYGVPELRATVPPGDWKLPELRAQRPVYALVPLGDREHLLVLDADTPEGFFDRCLFDADADRDLTDDPVLLLDRARMEYGMAQTHPVDASARVDGADRPFRFVLYLSCRNAEAWSEFAAGGDPSETLYLSVRSYWAHRAIVELRGKPYRLLLVDANANGRCDDTLPAFEDSAFGKYEAMRPRCDRIYLTGGEAIRSTDGFVFGRRLVVDGAVLELRPDIARGRLVCAIEEGPFVPVEVATETTRLTLFCENTADCLTILPGAKKIALPSGRYRVHEYVVERKGPDDETWRLSATATKRTPFVDVRPGAPVRLEFGEPYAPIAWVDERSLRSGKDGEGLQASIQFGVLGAAEEALTGLSQIEGESRTIEMSTSKIGRPKEPAYKVVHADGNIVAKGAFRYG